MVGGRLDWPKRYDSVSLILMGIVRERRKVETRTRLIEAGLPLFAERGFDLVTPLFEQYAAVARAGPGARHASWFIPLTVQFAAQGMRDPLLKRRFAQVLAEAPDGGSVEGQLLKALSRLWPASST